MSKAKKAVKAVAKKAMKSAVKTAAAKKMVKDKDGDKM